MTYDVVVIGSGLAGLVAAASAAAGGAKVGVISTSSGNLGLWSGLATGPAGGGRDVAEALCFFLETGERAGLPYRRAAALTGFDLLAASGRKVRAVLAPETMAAGDLRGLPTAACGSGLLVAGFTELADYPAALIAAEARAWTGLAVNHRSLSLGREVGHGSGPRIARLFDDRTWFQGFLDAARRVLIAEKPWRAGMDTARPAAIAFPPVLGLFAFRDNLTALSEALGCPVFELPALPPSIPGQRFWRFWRHRLEADGRVTFHAGRKVVKTGVEDGRCLWVADELTRFQARAFVLATGGVAGGGLLVSPSAFFAVTADDGEDGRQDQDRWSVDPAPDTPREPLFDLDTAGQGPDWLTWGPRTDRDGRPFQRAGAEGGSEAPRSSGAGRRRKPLANVFVAGWLLGGSEKRPPDACLSIVSGWRAGRLAASLAAKPDGERGGDPR